MGRKTEKLKLPKFHIIVVNKETTVDFNGKDYTLLTLFRKFTMLGDSLNLHSLSGPVTITGPV